MNLMLRLLMIAGQKPSPDLTKPSVVVTSNAVQPVATGTFTATFTFSEVVTGFVVGDITVVGGAASALNTSDNKVFTATITPTFLADMAISVAADVCQDASGNLNTASNTLAVVATYELGAVHTDNFNSTSLAAYTQNGTTMTAATGDLVMNTTAGVFTNYLLLDTPSAQSNMAIHCLEKWVMQVLFTCPALGATNYGFGVGIRSQNGPEQFDNIIRIAFDSAQEGNRGTVYYYSAQNHSVSPSQTVALIGAQLLTVGTDYIFEVERVKNVITARVKSADGSTTIKTYTSFTYNQTSTNTIRAHNMGKFGFWAMGGTITIKNLSATTKALKNPAIFTLEDSNGSLYAAANTNRTTEQVATALGKAFEMMWGINAEIPDVTAIIPAVLVLAHPTLTKIFVNIGSNDKANGVSDATRRTRYATMITTFNSGGFNSTNGNLRLGIPAARNGVDIALLKTDTDTTYSAFTRSDEYTATKDPANTNLLAANNIGDNIHLTVAGHTARVSVRQTALT